MPAYPQTTAGSFGQNGMVWPAPASPTGIGAYNPMGVYPYPQTYTAVPAILPTPSQAQKTTGIFGRFVNSASEITPNEISMDGSYSIFPLNDMSKILVKSWNTDGTISTLEFSPVVKSEKVDIKDEDDRISMILDKLSKLEEQLG